MSALWPTAPAVRGLLGDGAADTADARKGRGFAWSTKPAPPMPGLPPAAAADLPLIGADLARPSWQFLRGLDRRRPLSPRQARTLARIAARRGLGPAG
jgi:hypothetical protein